MEEHFSSLQEEVEVKTKKLKKLWTKYQTAQREIQDIQEEFQTERSDMLDTIRQLSRTLKLKDLIISNFIPEDYAKGIEKRATWNQEEDAWVVQKLDLSGNRVRSPRPVSSSKLRRPETEYARQRKQYDNNPRYRYENIISMDLDKAEKTTQDFDGPGMVSRVDPVLAMNINDNDDEEITFADSGIPNPYLQYNNDGDDIRDSNRDGEIEEERDRKTKSSNNKKK